MAFLRRKGSAYYLVHNIRRGGKVKQLHLATLGESPHITDDVVRRVNKSYPLLTLNWKRLREQVNSRVELFDLNSEHLQKLTRSLRNLNLNLADLAPPLLRWAEKPGAGNELVTQLRLLRSTVEVKLRQFEQAQPGPGADRKYR
ncbi:MAG TPA: hypothetical protein VGA40_04040 [Candidatus Acidoferrales bacterium]